MVRKGKSKNETEPVGAVSIPPLAIRLVQSHDILYGLRPLRVGLADAALNQALGGVVGGDGANLSRCLLML
jgi:hypothetical protein